MLIRVARALSLMAIAGATLSASTIAVGISGFSASATVVDFNNPSANPYTEAGAVFSSGIQNINGSSLNMTDFLNPVLNITLPFEANRVGLTNRGALPLLLTIQFYRDAGFAGPVEAFGPATVPPYDFGSPLTQSFLGAQSDTQFRSLRITATNSFSLADFRFEAVPEPGSVTCIVVGIAAILAAVILKTRLD